MAPASAPSPGSEHSKEASIGAGPGRPGQVIRLRPKTGERHMDWLSWGLLPHGTRDPGTAPRPIHARAETVAELPIFAGAFRRRRAIVTAAEYYQRRTIGEPEQRFAIARRDGKLMAIAGLWESFTWPDGLIERTYCIITVEAAGAVAEIHDRMPLVLEEKDWPLWLGETQGDPASLLHSARDDSLVLRPVGRADTRRHGSASR